MLNHRVQTIDPAAWAALENSPIGGEIGSLLAKSMLTAGTGVDAASYTDGRALSYESLDPILQSVTLTEEDCTLWRDLVKKPVHATVDQYNLRTSLGSRFGLAVGETTTPAEQLGAISRQYEEIAYYRDLRKVSDVMQMVNATENPVALEEQEAMTNIIQAIDLDLYWGNRDVIGTQINGWFQKMDAASGVYIKDMAGAKITERGIMNQAAARIRMLGGRVTSMYMNPLLVEDYAELYATANRVELTDGGEAPIYDRSDFIGIRTLNGVIQFRPDPFNWIGWTCPTAVEGNSDRPDAPATVTGACAGTDGTIPDGEYYYKVTSVNADGQSIGTASAAVTVGANEHVTLTIADPAGGNTATGFYIYRSAKNAGNADDCRFQWQVAATLGGGGTTWVDDGSWVPGTAHIPLADMRPNAHTMQWSQLLPASKLPLAKIGVYDQFLVNLYGAFRMSKPTWNGLIKNVLPLDVLAEGWDPYALYAG